MMADDPGSRGLEFGTNPGRGLQCTHLTCGKCLEIVTVLELPFFIQKMLWLKLVWIREFFVIKQDGVQCWN